VSELTATDRRLAPDGELVERFRRELDALIEPDQRIGIAVSGGPDSLALLLLASAARPGMVEAATVDHALREGSRAEAEAVASLCAELDVPHTILTVGWAEKPATAIQERARFARYRLLGRWLQERGLAALLTGHHVDDQAETLLMRLARGAGVRGLAAMRRVVRAPGSGTALVRPLLGWRRSELEQICSAAGLDPAADPSNEDQKFERVRVRKALAETEWLDPQAVSVSARNLAQADAALAWATTREWERAVTEAAGDIVYRPDGAPLEIRRRIVRRAVLKLAHEGSGADLRGPELNRLLAALASGQRATLRGVLCIGGEEWRFTPAPKRRLH
jgi:tRNA(Ile)-lysidine synthase